MTEPKRRVGRPSKAPQRIDDVLDAFTRCVARYGLDGTTLQRIADEAGMARGHIRHYAGNRDQLRELFRQRIISRYADRAAQLAAEGDPGSRAEHLVGFLFGSEVHLDDNAAIDALLAAARFDDALREQIRVVYSGLETLIAQALADDYPGRSGAICENAAYQILALAYGHWTLSEIGFPAERVRSAHRLALAVIAEVAITRPTE
ncbi:TetR/AcrR family transcriptional regulator [Micromonospora sp. NBC_01412]|uniref:TetR/AcrR family transcriptional regulator n=1 Tax=Micromonospora sp. NBC_01412 TaxID=2903590 RepID=UPI003244F8EE